MNPSFPSDPSHLHWRDPRPGQVCLPPTRRSEEGSAGQFICEIVGAACDRFEAGIASI